MANVDQLQEIHAIAEQVGEAFIERIDLDTRDDIKEELITLAHELDGHPMSNVLRMMIVGVLHGIGITDIK